MVYSMATKKSKSVKSPKEDSFIAEFNKTPDEKHWAEFAKRMKKDHAKYYYAFYPGGVKGNLSLRDAYAVIYNDQYKQLYKVPVIKTTKKGIEGATIYLKNLDVNRKAI
jgi:hypothetical protein